MLILTCEIEDVLSDSTDTLMSLLATFRKHYVIIGSKQVLRLVWEGQGVDFNKIPR